MNHSYPCCFSPVSGLRARLSSTVLRATAVFAVAAAALSARAVTLYGTTDDRQVSSAGAITDVNPMQSGYSGSTVLNPLVVFQLPALPAGKEFSAASLKLYLQGRDGTPTFNADLYALGVSASPAVLASDCYAGALDTASVLVQDNFLTTANVSGPFTTTAATLTDFLNAAYAGGSGAGQYVFFRVNPDVAGLSGTVRYKLYSAEYAGGANYWPTLTYSTVDAPQAWSGVPLGGGGKVTGIIGAANGDVYIRTDVGGAYLWNPAGGNWTHITDTLVPLTTYEAFRLIGVSSLAVDPSNTNQIYVSVGDSTGNGIYSSANKGGTWARINPSTPIAMDSNTKPVNVAGERLAVDPNNPNIVWFGSSQSGLYKGVNSAGTWTWTQIPAASVPFGAVPSGSNLGVTFVVCDKNGTSTIVYAGVYDAVGATGGVYKSTDNGASWTKVGGTAMTVPVRAKITGAGTLYVTQSGTVGKLLRGGVISAITPLAGVQYQGISVYADVSGDVVCVSEYNPNNTPYNRMWRSTNGGTAWSAVQYVNFNNLNYTRTEPDGTPSLMGSWFAAVSDILIDPLNPTTLWACDLYGVARTLNAQNLGTANGAFWNSLEKNLEETVVMAVKNAPTGTRVMTGVADVGGYRYTDSTQRPVGAGGQAVVYPTGGNRTSLDYCESNPNIWASGWVNSGGNAGSGAVSLDGGVNWMVFGQAASKTVTNSATAGVETWDVGTYIASQKAKGVNAITLALCALRNESTNVLYFHSREAASSANWPRLLVNGTTTLTATADSHVAAATATAATNYGANTTLAVSNANNSAPNKRWIYLKFDLSSVGTITTAELKLDRLSAANTTSYVVGVYASTVTNWVEGNGGADNVPAGELTWNNRPKTLASDDSLTYADPVYNPKYYDGATKLQGGRVAISSTNSNHLVWLSEGTSNVARYSKDRGVTWTASTGSPTSMMATRFAPSVLIQQLAADRVNGNFYLAKFNAGGGGNHYVYRSTDGGATFTQVGTASGGSSNVYRCQIVAAPGAAGDVWMSDDGVSSTTAGGLWRSTDGGSSWGVKLANVRAVRQVTFGKASGTGYTVFINGYVGGVLGVYRSDDYGANWTKLADVPSIASLDVLAGDMQTYGKVFIGYNGRGVFEWR